MECEAWSGLIWLRIGVGVGGGKCGNKPPGSIKCGEFLDYLRNCQLLRGYSAPWGKLDSWLVS